jgi:uncharacterized membrane protein YeaQ/YmgE (transglycosylase-associated protein family)
MGFISWILIGLIMGAIARSVLPGRADGGWVTSLVIGVIGAVVGGWIASMVGSSSNNGFFDLKTWIFAFIGSLVVLGIWGAISGKKS